MWNLFHFLSHLRTYKRPKESKGENFVFFIYRHCSEIMYHSTQNSQNKWTNILTLKITIFGLKMMVKSDLVFFNYFKIEQAPSDLLQPSAKNLPRKAELAQKSFLHYLSLSFLNQKQLFQELRSYSTHLFQVVSNIISEKCPYMKNTKFPPLDSFGLLYMCKWERIRKRSTFHLTGSLYQKNQMTKSW